MKRLHMVVEGATEVMFVEELLYPLLLDHGVSAVAHPMGGNVRWSRLKTDVTLHLKSDPTAFVTTFFDYYGLVHKQTSQFPGKAGLGKLDGAAKKKRAIEDAMVREIADALGRRFDARRFIPYVQMHELEGLLFSDPERAAAGMYQAQIAPALRAIRDQFPTPEDINDDPVTAPSKRIQGLMPAKVRYDKVTVGNLAALTIGLDAIRAACPLFDDWVTKLLALGAAVTPGG